MIILFPSTNIRLSAFIRCFHIGLTAMIVALPWLIVGGSEVTGREARATTGNGLEPPERGDGRAACPPQRVIHEPSFVFREIPCLSVASFTDQTTPAPSRPAFQPLTRTLTRTSTPRPQPTVTPRPSATPTAPVTDTPTPDLLPAVTATALPAVTATMTPATTPSLLPCPTPSSSLTPEATTVPPASISPPPPTAEPEPEADPWPADWTRRLTWARPWPFNRLWLVGLLALVYGLIVASVIVVGWKRLK